MLGIHVHTRVYLITYVGSCHLIGRWFLINNFKMFFRSPQIWYTRLLIIKFHLGLCFLNHNAHKSLHSCHLLADRFQALNSQPFIGSSWNWNHRLITMTSCLPGFIFGSIHICHMTGWWVTGDVLETSWNSYSKGHGFIVCFKFNYHKF